MKLGHILLKLNKQLNLTESEAEYITLKQELVSWEESCTADNESPVKRIYFKIHHGDYGVFVRLITGVIYLFFLRTAMDIINPKEDDPDF